jgi:hypothetical protein
VRPGSASLIFAAWRTTINDTRMSDTRVSRSINGAGGYTSWRAGSRRGKQGSAALAPLLGGRRFPGSLLPDVERRGAVCRRQKRGSPSAETTEHLCPLLLFPRLRAAPRPRLEIVQDVRPSWALTDNDDLEPPGSLDERKTVALSLRQRSSLAARHSSRTTLRSWHSTAFGLR